MTKLPEPVAGGPDEYALADLVTRVIDRGVIIQGDVTISVAGIDLVYVGLSVLLSSVETLREHRPGPDR